MCMKREMVWFRIVNFPNLTSNILLSPAYGVYYSSLKLKSDYGRHQLAVIDRKLLGIA